MLEGDLLSVDATELRKIPVWGTVLGGNGSLHDGESAPTQDHQQGHEDHYRRWAYETPNRFDRDKLQQALAAFPDNFLRIKGVVFLGGRKAPLAVHRIGRRLTFDEAPTAAGGNSRLVAIGQRAGFDPEQLTRLVEGALVTGPGLV